MACVPASDEESENEENEKASKSNRKTVVSQLEPFDAVYVYRWEELDRGVS